MIGVFLYTSSERVPLRGPTGRLLRSESRNSGVKGSQRKTQSSTVIETPGDTGTTERSEDDEKETDSECHPSKNYLKSIVKANIENGLLSDEKMFLIYDQKQRDQYCRDANKLRKDAEKGLKCLQGEPKKLFTLLAKGYQRTVRHKCKSDSCMRDYQKYSKCIKGISVKAGAERCGDKEYEALTYIINKIPKKDQINTMCCYESLLHKCVVNETSILCGQKAGEFVRDTRFELRKHFLEHFCADMYHENCDKYPEALDEFEDIFQSDAPKNRKHNEIYNLFYKIIINKINSDEQ